MLIDLENLTNKHKVTSSLFFFPSSLREYCLGVHPKKASVASSTNKGEDYKKPVWLWPPTLDKDQTQTIKVSGVNRIRFVFSVPLRLTGREKNDSFQLKMWQIVESQKPH